MKFSLMILLLIFSITFVNEADAQRRRPARKVVRKNVVHRKKVRRRRRVRARRTRAVHFRYTHLPRRGAVVQSLHAKALAIRFRNIKYRYYAGIWYAPRGAKWVIIAPPVGIRIVRLPVGYRSFILAGIHYHYYYGTYYREKGSEYEVVDTPIGAEVDALPQGYETKTVNGEEYYVLDDVYYMPSLNDKNEEILIAVEDPN